jgi:hypothetical protein
VTKKNAKEFKLQAVELVEPRHVRVVYLRLGNKDDITILCVGVFIELMVWIGGNVYYLTKANIYTKRLIQLQGGFNL